MSRRPTTAEILAAARGARARNAADGPPLQHGAPAADGSTRPRESVATANGNHAAHRIADAPAQANPATVVRPASIEAILREIRSGRESPIVSAADFVAEEPLTPLVPPSVGEILQRLRTSPPATASNVPPSMTAILARIRGRNDAVDGTPVASPSVPKPATDSTAAPGSGRPSTAEILAAARAKAAGKDAGAPSRPSLPAASSPPATTSRTSSILEAARRQGGAGGTAAAGSAPPNRKSKKPVAAATPRPTKAAAAKQKGQDLPRPVSMAAVLSAVRGESPADESAIIYPPLLEMVAELRRQEQRRRGGLRGESSAKPEAYGVMSSLAAWWHRKRETHHGASI